jgi:CO/xanthine dehydrogenase FAD-binding subunit
MDINTVTAVVRRPADRPGGDWRDGDAWLAGGTWLFSVDQPDLRRLVDLTMLDWDTLVVSDGGLEIGATCTISELYALTPPSGWTAGSLFTTCCEAFLASFKIWNSATVGGNICMSLPAGPMITLSVALEATFTIWTPDGFERKVDAADFVIGNNANILQAGEILRRVDIPASALRKDHAHRRLSLTHLGRSTAFLVGTRDPDTAAFLLTITAGTTQPVRIDFDTVPDASQLRERIEEIPDDVYFDDPNGTPAHRRHLIRHFAEEIRAELSRIGDRS